MISRRQITFFLIIALLIFSGCANVPEQTVFEEQLETELAEEAMEEMELLKEESAGVEEEQDFSGEPSAGFIIKKVDEVRSPQLDYTTTVEVTSYSGSQAPKSATYEVMIKGSDNTIIKTELPLIERGRVLLMKGKDLWAFFPDVSKPLRLSMQERLIGEVSNGDIARVNFSGDYTPKIIRMEKIDNKEHYVLELIANSPEVTYGKAILWAQKDIFRPLKAEFYAISGKLLKTCSYESYKMLAGAVRPTQLVMTDPFGKGKKSIIKYDDFRVGEIPDKYFTKDYMKKLMQ